MTTAVSLHPSFFVLPSSGSSRSVGAQRWSRDPWGTASLDWAPLILGSLASIRTECDRDDWDGEGAAPVVEATLDATWRFLAVLYPMVARGTPAPELTAEADGEVDVSWYVDGAHMLNVSVGPRGRLAFAAQLGARGSRHGTVWFDAEARLRPYEAVEDLARYLSWLHPVTSSHRVA